MLSDIAADAVEAGTGVQKSATMLMWIGVLMCDSADHPVEAEQCYA
jgi:hypothetical protein